MSLFTQRCACSQEIAQLRSTMSAVQAALATLIAQGAKLMGSNAQFLADVEALTAAVRQNTDTINQVKSVVDTDNKTIATLTQQIADLKAGNPGIDLSGLEAGIASLQGNNTTLASIATPAPVQTTQPAA